MSRSATIEPMSQMLGFVNPASTGHEYAQARTDSVQQHFLDGSATVNAVDHEAIPLDMQLLDADHALVYSDGGDGTVRRAIAAMIGVVPDDPEATANNFAAHRDLVPNLRYFAGAGGNANNWPLSAHGRFAVRPERLAKAMVRLGFHQPLIYEITDERGDIVRSNIATSGLGLGAAAIAAYELERAKPELAAKNRTKRLLGETAIVLDAMRHTPSFAFEQTRTTGDDSSSQSMSGVTGFELIKSRLYAKQGRTRVNVDDTRWQPVLLRQAPNVVSEVLRLAGMAARLKSGRHALPVEDLSGLELSLRLVSDEPVQFHADGETGDDSMMLPGQTLRMRLARIAVPTLIAA